MAAVKHFFTSQLPTYLNETGGEFPTSLGETAELFTSLDGGERALKLLPLVIFVLFPAIGWLLSIKIREAFNLDVNSSGIKKGEIV